MANNESKNKSDEDELNQNHDLWMNHKITDAQYFREVDRIKGEVY